MMQGPGGIGWGGRGAWLRVQPWAACAWRVVDVRATGACILGLWDAAEPAGECLGGRERCRLTLLAG